MHSRSFNVFDDSAGDCNKNELQFLDSFANEMMPICVVCEATLYKLLGDHTRTSIETVKDAINSLNACAIIIPFIYEFNPIFLYLI